LSSKRDIFEFLLFFEFGKDVEKHLALAGRGIVVEGGVFEGLVAVLAALRGGELTILVIDGEFFFGSGLGEVIGEGIG
jgi:acetyl-CoA carboxylase beta subunit